MIANADSWADIERYGHAELNFLRRFLELPDGIPSHDTFGRVFTRLDPAALRAYLGGGQVAIDGKALRGSHNGEARPHALHLVSAWACEAHRLLGQLAVAEKSNEITAIAQLLELLDLEGDTVNIDATGYQKEIAKAVVDKGADYVLAVKDNQPTSCRAVSDAFTRFADEDYVGPSLRRYRAVEEQHRRHEERWYFMAEVPAELPGSDVWVGPRSIGMVLRAQEEAGAVSDEVTYYIGNVDAKVKRFARLVRGHWSIESRQSQDVPGAVC